MLCKIADLITEVPEAGDLVPRCKDYLWDGADGADIIIRTDLFHPEHWPTISENMMVYMESGFLFNGYMLHHNGMMLHSSAVELDGKAYVFSGPCGMGKSTHTRLWQKTFGDRAQVFNDDKPVLRRMEDGWYAYGTPWCGKDGINQNKKVPLAGICFLKQAPENRIRRLGQQESLQKVLAQTIHRFWKVEMLDLMLSVAEKLVQEIPMYELENRPEPEAALLSYETMRRGAKESGL